VRSNGISQKRVLLSGVEVIVGYEPVDPGNPSHMAKGKVRRKLVEAVGRGLRHHENIVRGDRRGQAGGIVIRRIETVRSNLLDIMD
jgi:hypothetical protein